MGAILDSLTLTRNSTNNLVADSSGVTIYDPTPLKVFTNRIVHGRNTVGVTVLASTVDMPIFIPNEGIWVLASCMSIRRVVGSDAGAVTADIMKAASGTAPSGGTTCLASADSINLKSPAADIIANHTLATTALQVGPGSYFGLNVTGTLTAVVELITCEFRRIL